MMTKNQVDELIEDILLEVITRIEDNLLDRDSFHYAYQFMATELLIRAANYVG